MNLDVEKIYLEKKDELISTISEFIAQKSFYDEETIGENAPFGNNIRTIFDIVKEKCVESGIQCNDIDGYALEVVLGEKTSEDFGILVHLDTVPVQNNWDTNPYKLTKKDNWYYGLGASDDKGPAAIIFVILKYLNDLNLEYGRQLRVVFGGDEERGFSCLNHYFSKNEQMTFGVSPDAEFPAINFEKSIYDFEITKSFDNTLEGDVTIVNINSGTATNVVPQFCDVKCKVNYDLMDQFINTLNEQKIEYTNVENLFELRFIGAPAHGSTPEEGINSIFKFFNFINNYKVDSNFKIISNYVNKYLINDINGNNLNINMINEFGNTTNNFGILKYDGKEVKMVLNIRYTNAIDKVEVVEKVENAFDTYAVNYDGMDFHYIKENSQIYQELKKAYEEVTNEKFVPFAIGGGTYARMLENGLAFGPSADQDTNLHQKNERISEKNIELTFKNYLKLIENVCIRK